MSTESFWGINAMNGCVTDARSNRVRRLLGGVVLAAGASGACQALAAPARAQEAPGGAPVAQREVGPRCSGEAARPASLKLQLGKSTMMRLPEPLLNRSVGNPAVLQAMLVAPDTMYLAGTDVGSTNMIIQGKSGACSVVDVVVTMDTSAFEATLAAVLPDEKDIHVTSAADSLVLTGTVADATVLTQVGELAAAFVRRPMQPLNAVGKADPAPPPGASQASHQQAQSNPGARVVNLLNVSAPQQVLLEVKIAEVSKTLLEKLEAGATVKMGSGSWGATLLSSFVSGTLGGLLDVRKTNGKAQATFEAQKQDALVRILAEPNVMAISGQQGSFLAGGKIFIPVPQDNNRISLEEKEFGVGLRFTPTVLAGGRINLQVAPEVSELSREGASISATGMPGTAVLPLITTRRASTTVQLYDGQSFAIGGLIKNNLTTGIKGLPVLGEVPILGALFRSTDYQQDRSELLFVITAHLVKPLPPNYALPTDTVAEPSRAALMLGGRLDSPPRVKVERGVPATAASASGFELK
jgi:pilus assembly protein CpaC